MVGQLILFSSLKSGWHCMVIFLYNFPLKLKVNRLDEFSFKEKTICRSNVLSKNNRLTASQLHRKWATSLKWSDEKVSKFIPWLVFFAGKIAALFTLNHNLYNVCVCVKVREIDIYYERDRERGICRRFSKMNAIKCQWNWVMIIKIMKTFNRIYASYIKQSVCS